MERIMIIDDDDLVLKIVAKLLQKEGYVVMLASNGREAMHLIQQSKEAIDLIITDIMMPYSSGFEVISTLKKDPQLQRIPIIIITSTGNESAITDAYKLGVEDFLHKPLLPKELLARVKKIFSKSNNAII